jgi:nitrogenase molybdenum-iron protein alpha/beta subunit
LAEIEPNAFWDDMKWAREHYAELVRKYPEKWVAIVNKVVVAVGDSIKSVKREAQERTSKKHIPVIFVESGSHVY